MISKFTASPFTPGIGTQQTITMDLSIRQPGDQPIQSVTLYTVFNSVQMTSHTADLISGTALNGSWAATYTVPEDICYNYIIRVVATNPVGELGLDLVGR
jgi:hypothetical protein